MSESKIEEILGFLNTKSIAKELALKHSLKAMETIQNVLEGYDENLSKEMKMTKPEIKISYKKIGVFEAHFVFGCDTLVFMLHTNIFDFPDNHPIQKINYVKADIYREYCGVIQIYNFLTDSLQYNREADFGSLIGRIYINKEGHFFMEGQKPFSYLYSEFATMEMNEKYINQILEECILFCLKMDLIPPPLEKVRHISVAQKNYNQYNSGFASLSAPGFKFRNLSE